MVFEDLYDGIFGPRRSNGRSRSETILSAEELQVLKQKAENYDALASEIETLRLENKELKDVLKDLKEDGRKLKEVQEEAEKYYKALLRVRADFDNYQKRAERDKESFQFFALERIVNKLIGHYEDLTRAFQVIKALDINDSVKNGFEMILKNYEKLLKEQGVEKMECNGERFDPYIHEALMVEMNDELPENTIIEELEKGYKFKNKILRPAKVKITKQSNIINKNINEIEKMV